MNVLHGIVGFVIVGGVSGIMAWGNYRLRDITANEAWFIAWLTAVMSYAIKCAEM